MAKGIKFDEIKLKKDSVMVKMEEMGDIFGDIDLLMRFDIGGHTVDEMMEAEVFEEELNEVKPTFKFKTFSNIL